MKKGFPIKGILFAIIILYLVFTSINCKSKIYEEGSLKEGIRLVFQVMINDAIDYETDYQIERLRYAFDEKNITFQEISKIELGQFIINDINTIQEMQIIELLDDECPHWNYSFTEKAINLLLKPEAAEHIKKLSIDQTLSALRIRLEELRVKKAIIKKHEKIADQIIIELPPLEYIERIISILKTTGHLEIMVVRGGPAPVKETLLLEYNGEVPDGCEILKEEIGRIEKRYYLVNRAAIITGADIKQVKSSVDPYDNPAVYFTLSPVGARRFSLFTSENIGKSLAIVLDNKIQSVAVIQDRISEEGMIQGQFTEQQADDLALVLRAGALPVSIRLIEEKTIGTP